MSVPEENPYRAPDTTAGQPPAGPPSKDPRRLEELEWRVERLEWRLEGSWMFSDSFWRRVLAVYGHWFVGYLIFGVCVAGTLVIGLHFLRR